MDILNILTEIANNPKAKRYYVELEKYYKEHNLTHESEIINTIIEEVIDDTKDVDDDNNN